MELHDILFKQFPTQPDFGKFVDYLEKRVDTPSAYNLHLIFKYNNLLKQPLELKRLVAVKDGRVLEKPLMYDEDHGDETKMNLYYDYQQAMESVWYDGWKFDYEEFKGNPHYKNKTGKDIYYHSHWKGFAQWGSSKVMILSDMKDQPVTLNLWKYFLK